MTLKRIVGALLGVFLFLVLVSSWSYLYADTEVDPKTDAQAERLITLLKLMQYPKAITSIVGIGVAEAGSMTGVCDVSNLADDTKEVMFSAPTYIGSTLSTCRTLREDMTSTYSKPDLTVCNGGVCTTKVPKNSTCILYILGFSDGLVPEGGAEIAIDMEQCSILRPK